MAEHNRAIQFQVSNNGIGVQALYRMYICQFTSLFNLADLNSTQPFGYVALFGYLL